MNSYYYLEAEKNKQNANFLNSLEEYADSNKKIIYVLDRPLTDQKYTYAYNKGLIILSPNNKITIVDYGNNDQEFEDYVEDVLEDIGSISDKYLYKDVVGRPRKWRKTLLEENAKLNKIDDIGKLFQKTKVDNELEKKTLDLLISLFIGSINDIERVKEEVPVTTLDKIKQKIQLFDGDQTRFVYQNPKKKRVIIQGLSGTGKTELLLHKLKNIYINEPLSSIFFTCHNKILADNLRKRIPTFFNFMKVEQQIEWGKRLWCANAWGSGNNNNSGAYRYICDFYQIPFHTYSLQMSFSRASKIAFEEIKERYRHEDVKYAFTHMFIDESQDFDENFFKLCELVTEKNIYVAGDIFQNIFDENISSTITPDFLLGKCYRTDPKTLMFAHALGMGLFESKKLRWLEEKEWKDCGYNIQIKEKNYFLSREPLRRFEDLDDDFESLKIEEITDNYSDSVVNIIKDIIKENNTVQPDDIGIILLDQNNATYKLADTIELKILKHLKWEVNKAYESKVKSQNKILISNRNNVKGLEFPFVICITKKIRNSHSYRNSLYTMLTRSFIKSFLLIPPNRISGLTESMKEGLKAIITNKQMIITEPSDQEKDKIKTSFQYSLKKLSHYDLMSEIFRTEKIDIKYHEKLYKATQQMDMLDSDEDTIRDFILDNLKYLLEE